ncbi:MAG: DNA ligase D [Gemmatimonadetes bacterium]|nr:DNA ligase D [Gemmatimonadota bacterium]
MSPSDRLERYRAKRAGDRTPEPFGGEGATPATGHLYVFHKHRARNLHWDLRLELDGALESWAVPKGPSPDPSDKRLAMHVEPHPLDYAEFEGVIPEGEYGAGPSIVWDKGTWIAVEDPYEGLAKGKLLFELRGYKVRGLWTLVHTPKAGENHWLLIKERDGWVQAGVGTEAYPDDSIYSGLRVEELPAATARAAEMARRAARMGAGERPPRARDVRLMHATRREAPFDDPAWVWELKYDGYRLVAGRDANGDASLISRNGNDLTATFPDVARAIRGLPYEGVVMDGEVVVHDDAGLPSFGRLQKRGRLVNRRDIARAALELPASYYAFDLLALEGADLRGLPLTERKALLEEVLPSLGPVRYSEHIPERGTALYETMSEMGLEGVVGKRADGAYEGGRSAAWIKVAAVRTDDFVVVGFTGASIGGGALGALHLAQWVGGELVYAGSVGTGFTAALAKELRAALEALEEEQDGPPAEGAPGGGKHRWVRPLLVAEVRFREITEAGMVRHASFQRLRDDKPPEACVRDGGEPADEPLPEPPPVPQEEARVVPFTNLDKVFWPDAGFTKGDLLAYYEAIAPWLLPYLEDRPLVLTRFPDGIEGKSFYQKDAPPWAPDWIRTVPVWSEGSERELNYFVAEDVETLLYLVNLGTIPLHVWHSRIGALERPDWCLLDLDPKGAPFADVVEVALFLHDLCEEIALPHYVKTSGSTGLHVLVPLGGHMDYDQSRTLGELLARLAVGALPEIATVERAVRRREGKVYVDFLQNRGGQLMAAPFCARAKPGATVSAPLRWKEVGSRLELADYTIRSVPRRMRALKDGDPMAPVLRDEPDLMTALAALTERVAGQGG